MFVLVLVFMCELIIGMLAYIYHTQVGGDLHRNIRKVFQESYSVNQERTRAIDSIQQEVS